MGTEVVDMTVRRETGDPVLDWIRQSPPLPVERASRRPTAVRVEVNHRRHRDHPSWEVPAIPEDLFPLRAAGIVGHDLQHRPICAIVRALRPGELARIRSDHPVGPLCHALEDRCASQGDWQIESCGPDEWAVLIRRR